MTKIFKSIFTKEQLQAADHQTIAAHLGIEHLEVGDDYIISRMPVDERTRQPFGLLHGGASCVLAENLGSIASVMVLSSVDKYAPVGLEINANHLKAVKSGWVYGKVMPIKIGRRVHVWDIRITDDGGDLVCVSRLTVMIVERL